MNDNEGKGCFMDKKELFDALDDFSQQLLVTLADVEAIKKNHYIREIHLYKFDGHFHEHA